MKYRKRILIFLSVSFLLSSLLIAQALLKIYCIDVNQGSSCLIVSPTNKYVLIDAGDISGRYGDTVYKFIKSLGITHLDHTIATHYHADHIGGFPAVICSLSRGPNSNDSILGYCYDRGDVDTFTAVNFTNYKNATGSRRRTIGLGETLNLGGDVRMVCVVKNGKVVNGDSVAPRPAGTDYENYRSIGLILKYGFFDVWIGGDLTGPGGERDVETKVAPVVGNIDVYVANHHGSRNSSGATFLDSLRPEVAIFSMGPNNSYGHPHQQTIDRLIARRCYMYQLNENVSGGSFPIPDSGKILNTTAAITANNWIYVVNGDTYPIDGVRRDGTVLRITNPPDTIPAGIPINPQARIKNLGNTVESFNVSLKIGSVYTGTGSVSNLAPNCTTIVTFNPVWIPDIGNLVITCSTEVPRDSYPANDRKYDTTVVAFYDAQLKEILAPAVNDTFYTTEMLKPKVVINDSSYFTNPCLVKVFYQINNSPFYFDSIETVLNPSETKIVEFNPKPVSNLSSGSYRCSTWVKRNFDLVPGNNYQAKTINLTIISPWSLKESIPAGLRNKKVRGGGALVAGTRDKIYALKGNNTREFYVYHIAGDSWSSLETIPDDPINRKRVGKGASLTYNKFSNPDTIYAIKGNNTLEFWAYDVVANKWGAKPDVPYNPTTNKKVKGGSGIAFVKQGGGPNEKHYVYLLKGNNTNEFYAYDCRGDSWIKTLKPAPLGPDLKPYKDGSCISLGKDRLYVLKGGAKYNEFYFYEISTDTWGTLESLPRPSYSTGQRRNTKVKDGASLCWSGDSFIYAFKGGNNQEFWRYNINRNNWLELDTMPKAGSRKKIGSGAALTYTDDKIYALKGNSTFEFWSYDPMLITLLFINYHPLSTINTHETNNAENNIIIKNENFESAIVKIFNSAGQLVRTVNFNHNIKDISDLGQLKSGVYFIQVGSQSNNKPLLIKKAIILK